MPADSLPADPGPDPASAERGPDRAPADPPPALVACAHGTADSAGQAAVTAIRTAIAHRRPELEVLAASVDVQRPSLTDVLAGLRAARRRCVIVPLLLSAGYHVYHDVAEAVAASDGLAAAAGALGPDPVLADILADRLTAAGWQPGRPVVLAAAGSSDARAVADVEALAALLEHRLGAAVAPSYLSAAQPTVGAAVASASGSGPVAVANYLLAPGYFADRLRRQVHEAGGALISQPLAPDDRLADLALRRYDAAVSAAAASSHR